MSQFKTFVLPSESDATSEGVLNVFLRSHRIISVAKTYDSGLWRFCVEWLDGASNDTGGRQLKYTERVDYMKVLAPDVFAVFAKLREKRKEMAQRSGVPPFTVATDAQLAEMAKIKDPSLAKLGDIEGIGESRLKSYGVEFLSVLNEKNREKSRLFV